MTDTESDAKKAGGYRPPYVAWATLNNLFNRLGQGPIPPRIDKGYLDNYSGSTQTIVLATLKGFRLIDDSGSVSPELREMATDEDARRKHMTRILEEFYPDQLALARQNATSQQLEESFRQWPIQGSTLRKAIVFYLDVVKFTGAPNSPHFKPPKQTSSPTGAKRGRTKKQTDPVTPVQTPPPPPRRPEGEEVVVALGAAGSVTLIVDVKWLELPDEKFLALRKITTELRALEVPTQPEEADDDDPEDLL